MRSAARHRPHQAGSPRTVVFRRRHSVPARLDYREVRCADSIHRATALLARFCDKGNDGNQVELGTLATVMTNDSGLINRKHA